MKRLPDHVRLVLISRTEPPLKLSTLRVRQQILEIHEPDLTFTPEEIAALFSRVHGRNLTATDLAALHRQTGGWAAGLVLFAAALRVRQIRISCRFHAFWKPVPPGTIFSPL